MSLPNVNCNVYNISFGDLGPPLLITVFTDGSAIIGTDTSRPPPLRTPVALNTSTDTVTLKYVGSDNVPREVVMDITNATLGQVSRTWDVGDLPITSQFRCQVTVLRAGDLSFPRTYPRTQLTFTVSPAIPAAFSPGTPLINASGGTAVAGMALYTPSTGHFGLASTSGPDLATVTGLLLDASVVNGASGHAVEEGPIVLLTTQWDAIAGTSGGLTPNLAYYLDPSTPGHITSTLPTALEGQITFIGVATSATQLDISICNPVFNGTVFKDATALIYMPQTAAQNAQLVRGLGIGPAFGLYRCQENAFPLADSIGDLPLTGDATGLQFVLSGLSQKSIVWFETSATEAITQDAGLPDIKAVSFASTIMIQILQQPSELCGILNFGDDTNTDDIYIEYTSGGLFTINDGTATVSGIVSHGINVTLAVTLVTNVTARKRFVCIGLPGVAPEIIEITYRDPAATSKGYQIGHHWHATPKLAWIWGITYASTSAEMSEAQVTQLHVRYLSGP